MQLQPPKSIKDAYVLLNLGDSVTTDHISPAGNIARNSSAARYLASRGWAVKICVRSSSSQSRERETCSRLTVAGINIQTVHKSFLLHNCFDSLTPRDYNSYGSRRGNDAVMARGTFANIRLFNKFLNKQAPQTTHLPTGETVSMQHLSVTLQLFSCRCCALWLKSVFDLHKMLLPELYLS